MARKGEFECPPYFSVGETIGLPQKRKDYRRRKRAIRESLLRIVVTNYGT